jgi:tetratricopeptide (TPR) repeat protein
MVSGAFPFARRYWAPQPPTVNLTELDPAIADVLRNGHEAVRREPRSGENWGKLGVALLAYEFRLEAQRCLQEAKRLHPREPRWPYFLGLSLFPESVDQGLNELRVAVELHADKDSSVRNRLAIILLEFGRYEEAAEQLRFVLNRWPNDAVSMLGMGKIHFAQGDFEQSLAYLLQTESNPHTGKASKGLLVSIYSRLGEKEAAEKARQEFEKMPEDAPFPDPYVDEASSVRTGRKAWLDYATQLYRQGQISEALPWAERVVRIYPESGDGWILMARIQMRQDLVEPALESWRKAIDRLPDSVEAHSQLGVTLMRLRRIEEAIPSLRRALELKPNLSEGFHNLGLCHLQLGHANEAAEAFRSAIRHKPGFLDSLLGLAESLALLSQIDEARDAIQEARQLNANDPRINKIAERLGL